MVSLIDFHGVRKGDVGLVLGPCCDKKKVDWAERMQVSFGKGRQTEKCDYVRWHMRMADEHEVGAWEHVYVYDQRNSKELRGGRRYVAEGDTALWFRSGRH